jgi:glycosyltransferase involved in cell wall biosynthesis
VKKKLAIVTLHPHNYGGILSMMRAVWQFAEPYFDPKLFYLSFDADISTHFKRGILKSSIKEETLLGMQGTAIGVWFARLEPGHYWFNRLQWEYALQGYDYIFVVGGTPIAGHPITSLGKKCVLWAATPYDDDRAQRQQLLHGFQAFIDRLSVPMMRRIEQSIVSNADAVLGLSDYTTERLNTIAQTKKVISCGFPMALQTYELPYKEQQCIAVGRWTDPRKNLPLLLRTFERVFAKLPHAQLHIVGQMPDIADEISSRPYFKNVILHGHLDASQVAQLYRQSSLLLISSYQEGLGIVGLEALSHGLPVISTDCGGPRDFIVDGYNGFLVPLDDDQTMAEKVVAVLENRDVYQNFAANARQVIANKFSHEHIHGLWKQSLLKVYPELATTLGAS